MAETQPQSNTETSDGTAAQASPGSEGSQLEKSTYEIIRNRLDTHAEELRNRMDLLNELRREVFGSIPTELTGTERINTANNCVPRDIIAIGDRMLFGYNVHIGLRTETLMSDVFAVYRADEGGHFVEAQNAHHLVSCLNFPKPLSARPTFLLGVAILSSTAAFHRAVSFLPL